MNHIMVKTREQVSVCVIDCEVITSMAWDEENNRGAAVWGIRVEFSDGEVVDLPDLCTRQSEVEALKTKLEGAVLSPDFLGDVVDDYLGYIYGLPFCQ